MRPQRDCPQPTAGSLQPVFQYHPSGWRVWKGSAPATLYLHGPGGQLLTKSGTPCTDHVYFAGRLLFTMSEGSFDPRLTKLTRMYSDRLGSTRATAVLTYGGGSTTRNYYPFAEEIGSTANNEYKFASTYRDSTTGLDYAINRYYASGMGRFLAVDPKGGKVRSPQSFNRYSYAHNDPVNGIDPKGLSVGSVIRGIIGAILGDEDEEPQEADDWSGFIANGANPGSMGTGSTVGPPDRHDIVGAAREEAKGLIHTEGCSDWLNATIATAAANANRPTPGNYTASGVEAALNSVTFNPYGNISNAPTTMNGVPTTVGATLSNPSNSWVMGMVASTGHNLVWLSNTFFDPTTSIVSQALNLIHESIHASSFLNFSDEQMARAAGWTGSNGSVEEWSKFWDDKLLKNCAPQSAQ